MILPPLVARVRAHGRRVAVVDGDGPHAYDELAAAGERVARTLLAERADLDEDRVAFLCPPGFSYVATLLGIWRAGGVAVPLCASHPPPELAYALAETGARLVLAHDRFADRLAGPAREVGAELRPAGPLLAGGTGTPGDREAPGPPDPAGPEPASRRALILFTSGTTGRPKGAVTTHGNLEAQVRTLEEAWGWRREDRILHVLPLHHTHGIVNVLLCALWAGATCDMLDGFDAEAVWDRLCDGQLTLFMAVPTIYVKLIRSWEAAPEAVRAARSRACRGLRLMVSGSAALPAGVLARWEEISGHRLLERYGMTEIGMALSNPLEGERRAGSVGRPLPSVEVRLVDEAGAEVREEGRSGQIEVRGPGVFLEYWGRPEETRAAFGPDGWFRTGDEAVLEDGYYRILGRRSVDIIKTGGYKVSALEIEEALRDRRDVAECAVVGVPDPEWGERVCAAVVPAATGDAPSLEEIRAWGRERLAPYKLPSRLIVVGDLPRNVMGKVMKPDVRDLFEADAPENPKTSEGT
ncbi:MAG: acyl-CoA synthetase [Gemmatimonadota bacterium]